MLLAKVQKNSVSSGDSLAIVLNCSKIQTHWPVSERRCGLLLDTQLETRLETQLEIQLGRLDTLLESSD